MKILIEGDTKSGKTTLLKKKYKEMVNSGIDSNRILVVVSNRMEAIKFKKNLILNFQNEKHIYSYFGFIQRELIKFWPFILKKSKKINKDNITPTFMTFEASQCLMGKTVEYYRNHGYLNELNISNEEISKKILSNILDASLNDLIYTRIGERLNKNGETNHEKIYKEMNMIINKYMEKTLESGTFDYGTSVYLYNIFLLKNKSYIKKFKDRIDYILVDSGELAPIVEVDFIDKVKDNLKGIIIVNNTEGPYGIYNYFIGYLKKTILNSEYKKITLKNDNKKADDFLNIFETNLYSNKILKNPSNLYLDMENKYKSINNKNVVERVEKLLDASVLASDIAIIVPQSDIVLEFTLQKMSEERGFKFMNIGRNEKVLDNPYAYTMVIFSILFYKFKKINLNFDEMKMFFSFILELDPIRSAILTNYIGSANRNKYELIDIKSEEIKKRIPQQNLVKYDKIRDILKKLPKDIKLYNFFEVIYTELLIPKDSSSKNIKGSKELIDSSKKFIETLRNFKNIKDINYEFIKFLREGGKASETLTELNERLDGNYLSISTPYGYINSGKTSKYQIWTDVRNKNFIPSTKNILQNSWVFSKMWRGKRFSIEDEFKIEKINTMGILKRLVRSCDGNIYIYGSEYSSGSHKQTGFLYNELKKIK